jgi:hypothetical protein
MSSEIAGRRGFFRLFARESVVALDELRGRPQLRLADLPQLPDATLEQIAPAILEGVTVIPEEQRITARPPACQQAIVLFARDPVPVFIFNRFNGRSTLAQISKELSAQQQWPQEQSFAAVKALFFRLVRLRVCVPANCVR